MKKIEEYIVTILAILGFCSVIVMIHNFFSSPTDEEELCIDYEQKIRELENEIIFLEKENEYLQHYETDYYFCEEELRSLYNEFEI